MAPMLAGCANPVPDGPSLLRAAIRAKSIPRSLRGATAGPNWIVEEPHPQINADLT